MRSARLVPAIALGAGLAVLVAPATAAPAKKPITKSFAVTIPVPVGDPTATQACVGPEIPGNRHVEKFKAPAIGSLKLEVTGFVGDWDVAILDAKGKRVAEGDNASAAGTAMSTGSTVERATLKVKKPGDYQLVVCNFTGSPSGTGKYTFTFAK
jgi:hypothetical protein